MLPTNAQAGCNIYLHDAAGAAGFKLPSHYAIPNWRFHRYSQERWVREALVSHRWRVRRIEDADFVVLDAKFTQICTARKTYAARHLWHIHLNDSLLCDAQNKGRKLNPSGDPRCLRTSPPKLLILSNTECNSPWSGWGGPFMPPSRPPPEYMFALDRLHGFRQREIAMVIPAVLARPAWLTGAAELPPSLLQVQRQPWMMRKLLFFPGHIPKLYVSALRFRVWNQIRTHSMVTAASHTLACTVGAYRLCQEEPERITREHLHFCKRACGADGGPRNALAGTFAKQGGIQCAAKTADMLRRQCIAYQEVNFSDTILNANLERDSRFLTHEEYVLTAFGHRFCLAVPGDFMSASPKITEFIAVGGVGGCIPVLVVPTNAWEILPHAHWLNYCSFAYLVHTTARNRINMPRALARLANVSADEAAAKQRALRTVRDAFVWREPGPTSDPSAADYILQAACMAVRNRSTRVRLRARRTRHLSVDGGAAGMLTVGGSCVLA